MTVMGHPLFITLLISIGTLCCVSQANPLVLSPAPRDLSVEHLLLEKEWPEGEPKWRAQAALARSIYRNGEDRTGVEARGSLPLDLTVDWRVPWVNIGVHTASKASPAVDDSGIYVGSDSAWFYAFDHEGNVRWRKFVPGARRGIHGTALLDQDLVYFGAYNGIFYALEKKSGAVAWTANLGQAIGSSPVLYKNRIYIAVETTNPSNGFVGKLHARTGKVIWKSPQLGEQPHSSPVINAKDNLVHVGANNGKFFGLDLNTGRVRWSMQGEKPIKGTALLIKKNVCFGTWGAKLYCLKAKTGKKSWEAALDGKIRTSPTFVPTTNSVVVATEKGSRFALELTAGKILWRTEKNSRNLISSSLAVRTTEKEGGEWVVWDICQKKTLCALSAKWGVPLKKIPLPGHLTSVPVFYDQALYVSLDKSGGLLRLSTKEQRKKTDRAE